MEHNAIQWSGAASCQRGGFSFYKSVSSRCGADGPVQVWRLGEFYLIRCGPQDPVCIAEVTLLWEDQARRHLLASTRLYFLPEDTPKGRTREHGEDEVLAVSRKMVVRVEDLVRWTCAESAGLKTASSGTNGLKKTQPSSETFKDTPESGVKVLSYPQYCRFRSLQRRLQEGARGAGLQDPHLLALGAVRAPPSARLMYCRDTFNHPTLETNTGFSWQFRCPSLSLRGRPRKRRGRDGKDSPSSSQSDSWIDRMKENVMGSVEVGCESSWLPDPEEQLFLDQLFAFMERCGSPINKVPNLGFKKIDLFIMYSVVKRLGGYKRVTLDRLWKIVYNELGGCPGSTSAATCTRRHYERLMLPYEEHLRAGGAEFKVPESPTPSKPRGIRGRKPLQRGRKPGPRSRDKKTTTTTGAGTTPSTVHNGSMVVKRGRGRPPGTRNKTTLITQAKLVQQQITAKESQSLLPAAGEGGPNSKNRPVQPATLPINMPLTPDLSPMSAPFLPFQPKPKLDRGESPGPGPGPGVLLSTLPHHFVGGSLGGFSPIKGVCPLDVFRSRIGLQRGPESPALTPQDPAQHLTQHHSSVYALQPKSGSPDTPCPSGDQVQVQLLQQQHNRCSGCSGDEAVQRREARTRPPLPPLRVLPLNLDCSVQVCQLMRTRLGSSQFQTFTRRLSEALSQDLDPKPPCSPITPPPEQALPLNLSKRFAAKRPGTEGPGPGLLTINGTTDPPPSKRPRAGCAEAEDYSQGGRSSSTGSGEQDEEVRNQEEPADLSSPSRIRAFLLGLPPFQVKFEDDLNGTRFGKFPETQRTETETGGEGGGAVAAKKEGRQEEEAERSNKLQKQEDPDPAQLSGPGPAESCF